MKKFVLVRTAAETGLFAARQGLGCAARALPPFASLDGLRRATAGVALVGGLLMLAPIAQATPLTAASSSVYINTGTAETTGSIYASLGGGTGSISLYPFVTLQAQIDQTYTQDVIATLDYYFEIVGGTVGANVPVLITTNLLTSGTYPEYGGASIGVFTGGGAGLAGEIVCTYSTDCSATQFSGNLSLTAVAGSEYRIHLSAVAEGLGVSASVDPYIFVDPTFADASAYSVEVSAGVGNSPASVPTPGTLPLFGSALGLFCLVSRWRKRGVPPVDRFIHHSAWPPARIVSG